MKPIEDSLNKLRGPNFIEELELKASGYRLKGTLGQGNFAEVKKALHIDSNIEVAVKNLDKYKMINNDDTERVNREIQILSKLNHPNISYLYEILNEEECFYFVLEYCKGGDLANYLAVKREEEEIEEDMISDLKYERLKDLVEKGLLSPSRLKGVKRRSSRGKIPEKEACKFYCQILSALAYMHQKGVAHRDLKPENILLDEDNNIKIIDFNLGNLYSERQLLSTACGSPCYAPPEMISGVDYDPKKSDLWSLGITLYIMLCGEIPFQDNDLEALYQVIVKVDPIFPDFLSEKSKDFLKGILKKNPEERFGFEEAFNHPWVLENKPDDFENLINLTERRENLDIFEIDEITKKVCKQFELSENELNIHLRGKSKNCISAQYYLLLHQKDRLNKELNEIKQSVQSSQNKKKRILEKLPFKASPSLETTPKKSISISPLEDSFEIKKRSQSRNFEEENSNKENFFQIDDNLVEVEAEPPIKIKIVEPLKLKDTCTLHQFTPNTNHRSPIKRLGEHKGFVNKVKNRVGQNSKNQRKISHIDIKPLKTKILSSKIDISGYQNLRKTKKKLINRKLGFIKMNSGRTDQKYYPRKLSKNHQIYSSKNNGENGRGRKNRSRKKSRKRNFTDNSQNERSQRHKEMIENLERLHARHHSGIVNREKGVFGRSLSRDHSSNFTFQDKSFTLRRNISLRLGSLSSRNRRLGLKKKFNPRNSRRKSSSRAKKTKNRGLKTRPRATVTKNSGNNRSKSKSKILKNESIKETLLHPSCLKYTEKIFSRASRKEKSPMLQRALFSPSSNLPNFMARKISQTLTAHQNPNRSSINSYENHFGKKYKIPQYENFIENSPKKKLLSTSKKRSSKRNFSSSSKNNFGFNNRSYSAADYLTPKYKKSKRFFNSRKSSTKKKSRAKITKFGETEKMSSTQTELMETYFTKENEYNYVYLKKMSNMLRNSKVKKKRVNQFTLKIGKLHKKLNSRK